MHFITLTKQYVGAAVQVRPDAIAYVQSGVREVMNEDGSYSPMGEGTELHFINGTMLKVAEEFEHVMNIIRVTERGRK